MMRYVISGILGGIIVLIGGVLLPYFSWSTISDERAPLQEVRERTNISLWNYGLKDLESELIKTIHTVEESVVSVIASKDYITFNQWRATELLQEQVWWWSGMIISSQGYILTNKHVVEDEEASYTVLFSNWESAEVQDIRLDKTLDIAVLNIWSNALNKREPIRISDFSTPTEVWQFVIAIGNALAEFNNSATFGVISWNNRTLKIDNWNVYAWLLQTDTSISEGNSWGPLFNLDGEVIAINTAVSSFGENIWFAIPLTQQFVDATLQSIKNNNDIVRPFVWVRYTDIDSGVASEYNLDVEAGIYVSSVIDQSPAQLAWIGEWDIITQLNGIKITTERPFLYQLFTYVPWDTVDITYIRDGKEEWEILILGN